MNTTYTWITEGERCCLTSRLLPLDRQCSPCLAVVRQVCPTNHREVVTECSKSLRFSWVAFAGTKMTAPVLRGGTGMSLENCQWLAVDLLALKGIIRRTDVT